MASTLNAQALFNSMRDHLMTLGLFERVDDHESLNPPSARGLAASVWADHVGTSRENSGLSSVTGRVQFTIRIQQADTRRPAKGLNDVQLLDAVSEVFRSFCADFELAGGVKDVDVYGANGDPLGAEAAYIELGGTKCRVYDVTVPLIINDLWPLAP